MRNAYSNAVRKPEGMRPFERPRHIVFSFLLQSWHKQTQMVGKLSHWAVACLAIHDVKK
jgi:hypothetical protein